MTNASFQYIIAPALKLKDTGRSWDHEDQIRISRAVGNRGDHPGDVLLILAPTIVIYIAVCGICFLLMKKNEKEINKALEGK